MLKHTMHRFEEFCFFLLSLLPGDAYYIGGPENLPPPLDHEQEELVFEQLETGNPHARELLITHNLRLVVYIAKKFENSGVSVEDIISIGTIGLIKAVNTFKPSKKSNWPPTPAAALKTRYSCICAKAATAARRPASTNR